MSDRKTDPRVEAEKMAALAIVWSALAAVAYLGPIQGIVEAIKQSVHASSPIILTSGLRTLRFDRQGLVSANLFHLALTAMPFAIGAALLLAILARVRPQFIATPIALTAAMLVGLAASVALFLNQVYTPANEVTFLVALGTIAGVWLLVRLERYVRRLHRRNPAVSTLLLTVLVVAYLVATNTATISSLILGQIDLWLAVVSFLIALYAAIRLTQESIRLQG